MAVVELGPKIKTTLGKAIAYIINPGKTLDGTLVTSNYERHGATAPELTSPMVDDIRSTPRGMFDGGRMAYHVILSFSPDDPVTAEKVHELGVRFAELITNGDYKYVVATHIDRAHLHDHIIICAANETTGLKMRLEKNAIDQWREVADELCRQEGLSIIAKPMPTMANQPDAPVGETPNHTAEGQPRQAVDLPRTGLSMGELYAEAKGTGVKDRLRTLIELSAARSESFDEFTMLLEASGVRTTVRGSHLTFTMDTGMRVRDTRLGPGYDMTDIMARLGRTHVLQIAFNERLVAKATDTTVTVWLPGTKRRRRITIDRARTIQAGHTWRAFLPSDRRQTILDRANRYVAHVQTVDLYQWFGEPARPLEPLCGDERLPDIGVTDAQRRFYRMQAVQLDRLQQQAKALNAAAEWAREAGGDANRGLALLRERVRESRADLQAAVIALVDAVENGDKDLQVESRDEMELREATVRRYEEELNAIEHVIGQDGRDGRAGREQHGRTR